MGTKRKINNASLPDDTLIQICVKNTSTPSTNAPGDPLFLWSVSIETDPKDFRKEIDRVIYHLHPTFPNKDIAIADESQGFILVAQGWGEFEIGIEIILKDGRKTELSHYLSLFSESRKVTTKTLYKMDFSKQGFKKQSAEAQ